MEEKMNNKLLIYDNDENITVDIAGGEEKLIGMIDWAMDREPRLAKVIVEAMSRNMARKMDKLIDEHTEG